MTESPSLHLPRIERIQLAFLDFSIITQAMPEENKPARWFCRSAKTGEVEGPFDLMELAALLRSGYITGETLTQTEEGGTWLAFQNRQEFKSATDMPVDVVIQHLKDEKRESPSIRRKIYFFFTFLIGLGFYAVIHLFQIAYHVGNWRQLLDLILRH